MQKSITTLRGPILFIIIFLFFILLLKKSPPLHDSLQAVILKFRSQPCPSPWSPLLPPPLSQQQYSCFPIQTNSTSYTAKLCANQRGVCNAGYVEIENISGRCQFLNDNVNASPFEEMNRHVKEELGPDTFSVLFDGPSREVGDLDYQGDCRYRYYYDLKNGGNFTVRIILVYDEYRGLDEMHQESWQEIINESILEKDFQAPTSCSPECTRYQYQDYDAPPFSRHSQQRICDGNEKLSGSWLPTFSVNSSIEPYTYGKFSPYNYVNHYCSLNTAAVDFTALPRDRARCFGKSLAVLLTGDSHLRWLYDGLVEKMQGAFEGHPPNAAKYGKAQEKDHRIAGITLNYYADPVLSSLKDEVMLKDSRYSHASHIIVTGVQWLVHRPFSEYKAHLDLLLKNIEIFTSKHPSPPRFLWFSSPAWPHRSDEDVISHNDTRTNPRIRKMNSYAEKKFHEAGYSSIDSFSISEGFIHGGESPDNAHWYGRPVMEVLHDLVAHRLDLC